MSTIKYTKDYLGNMESLPQGVKLCKTTELTDKMMIKYLDFKDVENIGENSIPFSEKPFNSGISLYIPKNTIIDNPIKIEFSMDKDNSLVLDYNIIVGQPYSQATILIDYNSSGKVDSCHKGFTKVYAKENSIINIIKLQRMNNCSSNLDSNIAFVYGGGKVNWISVELGGSISGSNYKSVLEEEASESNLSSIYLGHNSCNLILDYTMIHKGPRSISNIETRGVLMDTARKTFKGTLDFKKGARHSIGVEKEYIILLDPTVKSDSIPALLCEEDDVEGEHAVSAGQIDKSKLFYLMSRGLSENQAKKLVVEASFRPIIEKIPFENLQNIINDEIERRLMYV